MKRDPKKPAADKPGTALAIIPAPQEKTKEERRDRRGRPTCYDPSFTEMARELSVAGATIADLAEFFGVTGRTIYFWRNIHPDFAQAIKVGDEFADDNIERSLYERAHGYTYTEQVPIKVKGLRGVERVEIVRVERVMPGDPQAMKYWLGNRRADKWRERSEKHHTGGVEVVHVTLEQAREKLRAKMAQIRDATVDLTPASKTVVDTDLGKEQG